MNDENKIIYKELSFQIVGVLFDVYNELGPGYNEKYYENAISIGFKKRQIEFKRQVQADLLFENEKVGMFFLDFLIENKIILEIKVGSKFSKQDFNQVHEYLKSTNKKLAILAIFTQKGVRFIRILNLNNKIIEDKAEIRTSNLKKLFRY